MKTPVVPVAIGATPWVAEGTGTTVLAIPEGTADVEPRGATFRGGVPVDEMTTAMTPATRSATEHETAATTHIGGRRRVCPRDVSP